MEKFQSTDKFSVFNLWKVKKVNIETLHQKTVTFAEELNKESTVTNEQHSPHQIPDMMKDGNSSNGDVDMALPDDKYGGMPPPATVIPNDDKSYSSQIPKLNLSMEVKTLGGQSSENKRTALA